MTDNLAPDLLARYLSGEASDAERRVVERWAEQPGPAQELARLRAAWTSAPKAADWDADRAWARVSTRLDAAPVAESRAATLRFKPRSPILAVAAAALLVLGAAWLWSVTRPGLELREEVHATAVGEQRSLTLADGSRIVLAPRSTLRVAADFGSSHRRVDLEGEAWFEVTHDASRPFLVYAAGTITEDLGTEFLVRQLDDGAGVEVALRSGSASLRREGDSAGEAVVLEPDDIAVLVAGATRATVQREAGVEHHLAWREGRLEFRDATAASVAVALGRWYPVIVVLDPAVSSRRFTGALRLDALDDALEVFSTALGAGLLRQGDTVVVR